MANFAFAPQLQLTYITVDAYLPTASRLLLEDGWRTQQLRSSVRSGWLGYNVPISVYATPEQIAAAKVPTIFVSFLPTDANSEECTASLPALESILNDRLGNMTLAASTMVVDLVHEIRHCRSIDTPTALNSPGDSVAWIYKRTLIHELPRRQKNPVHKTTFPGPIQLHSRQGDLNQDKRLQTSQRLQPHSLNGILDIVLVRLHSLADGEHLAVNINARIRTLLGLETIMWATDEDRESVIAMLLCKHRLYFKQYFSLTIRCI